MNAVSKMAVLAGASVMFALPSEASIRGIIIDKLQAKLEKIAESPVLVKLHNKLHKDNVTSLNEVQKFVEIETKLQLLEDRVNSQEAAYKKFKEDWKVSNPFIDLRTKIKEHDEVVRAWLTEKFFGNSLFEQVKALIEKIIKKGEVTELSTTEADLVLGALDNPESTKGVQSRFYRAQWCLDFPSGNSLTIGLNGRITYQIRVKDSFWIELALDCGNEAFYVSMPLPSSNLGAVTAPTTLFLEVRRNGDKEVAIGIGTDTQISHEMASLLHVGTSFEVFVGEKGYDGLYFGQTVNLLSDFLPIGADLTLLNSGINISKDGGVNFSVNRSWKRGIEGYYNPELKSIDVSFPMLSTEFPGFEGKLKLEKVTLRGDFQDGKFVGVLFDQNEEAFKWINQKDI